MIKRKNRRTLRKRIKRAMSLSAFFTVLFLSGVIIYMVLMLSKSYALNEAEMVSYSIQQQINTDDSIKSFENQSHVKIDINNPKIQMWINDISNRSKINEFIPYREKTSNIYVTIIVNDKILYSNDESSSDPLSKFYSDTKSVKPILDSDNKKIGEIVARVNPKLLTDIVIPILVTIIGLSILALLVSKIVGLFLVIPITNPLKQLETKIKAIAEGDQETAANTQIILKKPLREIESLADSTNSIMKKLQGYNDMLENQKDALENQNSELEMQNEELIQSKMQIQKQQAQLVQSEKMASVGLLTAAITHEINTPIGAINSNEQLEEMILNVILDNVTIQSDNELFSLINQLKEANNINLIACSRITEIIKSLKSFSRLDQADFQEANINEGIKSVLVLTNNLLKRRITVHEDYGDIPLVKCYPGQLNQVFMNVIVNAIQAIEGEGEIFIKTFLLDRYIYITIKDTGTGIKEENLQKIFDPGFTTKGVGLGLGLGLYISYNIVQNHIGEIFVNSEFGNGAEFTIKIPIDNDRT